MHETPILIVGNGLAACHLAWQLRGAGSPVRMIGNTSQGCASEVAAGVLNPVTGKRLARSWRVETLLPFARGCYRALEKELGIHCLHELEIRRYCLDERDVKTHAERTGDPAYASFLGPLEAPGSGPDGIVDEFGSFIIRQVGYVDLPTLLGAMRGALHAAGAYTEETFAYGDLTVEPDLIRYRGERFAALVFCEGNGIAVNPWFDWLPFRPVKGEILTVRSGEIDLPPAIYHHRKWILPLGDGQFRIGSTYERGDHDPQPTEAGRQELLAGLQSVFTDAKSVEVVEHRAGIRPCTRDTRPYLGCHPEHPALLVLNGLGAKGALLAPWLSRHLLEHLRHGKAIDPELDCVRYAPLRP